MYLVNNQIQIEYPRLAIDNYIKKNEDTNDMYRQIILMIKNILLKEKSIEKLPSEIIETILYNVPNNVYKDDSYDTLIKMKGITRTEFDGFLEKHSSNENTGVNKAKIYIEKIEDIFTRKKYLEALAAISNKMIGMLVLKDIENKTCEFLNNFEFAGDKDFKECEIIPLLLLLHRL